MMGPGRVCMKIAGRDANKVCVILEQLDNVYVLVDGATRRKKVNIAHLEPMDKTIQVSKNSTHEQVLNALADSGFNIKKKKPAKGFKQKVAAK